MANETLWKKTQYNTNTEINLKKENRELKFLCKMCKSYFLGFPTNPLFFFIIIIILHLLKLLEEILRDNLLFGQMAILLLVREPSNQELQSQEDTRYLDPLLTDTHSSQH